MPDIEDKTHFRGRSKSGHADSETGGHAHSEMTGHLPEMGGHDGLKYAADSYKASFVRLNGPRYWMIDGLRATGDTVNHERKSFGGIEMNWRATIKVGLLQQLQELWGDLFYQSTIVHRNTTWIYKAGSPVYELISPSGELYVMQSYAQIVNPKLSMADLASLEQQLQLPKGWSYRTRLITEDLHLVAKGTAYVLQDNLLNSYQRQ